MKYHTHHGKNNDWVICLSWGSYKVYRSGYLTASFKRHSKAVQYVKDEERREEERGW